jgi:hypothetical protein
MNNNIIMISSTDTIQAHMYTQTQTKWDKIDTNSDHEGGSMHNVMSMMHTNTGKEAHMHIHGREGESLSHCLMIECSRVEASWPVSLRWLSTILDGVYHSSTGGVLDVILLTQSMSSAATYNGHLKRPQS